jgi:hypothetical protein
MSRKEEVDSRHTCPAINDAMMGTEHEFEKFSNGPGDNALRSIAQIS